LPWTEATNHILTKGFEFNLFEQGLDYRERYVGFK
jgi:hypothetical protein